MQSDLMVLSPAIVIQYGTSVRDIAICSARLFPWSKSWTSDVTFGGRHSVVTLLTHSVTECVNECFVNKQQSVPALIFHHIAHWMQYWHSSKTAIWSSYNKWAQKHKNYIRQYSRNLGQNITRQTPFLSDVVFIFLRSILVLTTNGQYLEYANIAFSEL